MPGLKSTDLLLKENGFISEYILNKERQLILDDDDLLNIKHPLGQKMDIVLPKKEIKDHNIQYKQFIDIFGTPSIPDEQPFIVSKKPSTPLDHKYVHNDQIRLDVIEEFIQTETNFVNKLEAIVKRIVLPLKKSCENDKYPILPRYEFNNIYLTMEQIYEIHDEFLKALNNKENDFATTCEKYMKELDKYRPYLLKMGQVHQLNDKHFRDFRIYRGFLISSTKKSIIENLTFRDILDVPWKRVTNYPMLIQRIRNHTSENHPDFKKLTNAFIKVDMTASSPDDIPTILSTKSYEFRTMIKDSPDDIIKQSSIFVTHWDATEINRENGKLQKYVSLFLFRDKIVVLKRSRQAKGADLCDCFTSSPSKPLSKKIADQFKFLGKVPIEHIEITHGPSSDSIIIRASSDFQERRDTVATSEKHFTKGARVYQIDFSHKKQSTCINDKNHFVDSFYKNQAYSRLNGNNDTTYYRSWNDINVYSNVYDYETYPKVEFKNNIVAILLEKESTFDISSLINNTSNNSSSPWIVALVRPDTHGLKLSIWSKESLVCLHEQKQSNSNNDGQLDFCTVFWNNVITCERKLRCSSNYRLKNETIEEQQEMERQNLRDRERTKRSSSRSPFRSRSISIPKIFTRSRSQSPASSINSNHSPQSSQSTSMKDSSFENEQDNNNRSRSFSISSNNDMDQKDNTSSNQGRRRKFSFDTSSIFKREIKPSSSTSTTSSSHSKQSSTSQSTSSSIFNNNKELNHQHKRHSISINTSSTSSTTSSATIIPNMIHPTELPSPPYLIHQSRKQNNDSPTSLSSTSDQSNSSKSIYPTSSSSTSLLSSSTSSTFRLSKTSMEGFQLNHTSEPLVTPPPTRNGSFSSAATFLSTSSSSQHHPPHFGTMNSNSTHFNTMSSYASQSSRSSFSLEELDQMKDQGPSPRNIADTILSNNNHHVNNNQNQSHYQMNENDDLAYKVVSDMMNQQFNRHQKSLSPSYYKSMMDQQQNIQSPPSPSTSPQLHLQQRRQSISNHHQDQTLDHVNIAVDHLSHQVMPKFQFILDKQRLLGNQVKRINDRLPSNDYDASLLNEMINDTHEESSNVYNSINNKLEDINNILNAYHLGQQMYRQRLNSYHEPIIPNEADILLKNKLKETQKERDYWRRRASELNSQVNEFIHRQ